MWFGREIRRMAKTVQDELANISRAPVAAQMDSYTSDDDTDEGDCRILTAEIGLGAFLDRRRDLYKVVWLGDE